MIENFVLADTSASKLLLYIRRYDFNTYKVNFSLKVTKGQPLIGDHRQIT